MKKIVAYLVDYWHGLNKRAALLATAFVALAIFLNYYVGLSRRFNEQQSALQFAAWYALFLLCLLVGYAVQGVTTGRSLPAAKNFWWLLALAPAVFAWKMTAVIRYELAADPLVDDYWNAVLYWPFKLVVIVSMLYLLHRQFHRRQPFYGATLKGFTVRPYLVMLLIMLPLILAASTLPDFQRMYPRFQSLPYLQSSARPFEKLLYELAYGLDFFSIELYFRGFLVIGFAQWVGKQAILPMAIFYCAIHFGKPLGECISSYFGGMILGVVAYRTRTIVGGFFAHVGIAWLMEVAGYFSHQFLQ